MSIERNRPTLLRAFLALQLVRRNTPVVPDRCDRNTYVQLYDVADCSSRGTPTFQFLSRTVVRWCRQASSNRTWNLQVIRSYFPRYVFAILVPDARATRPAEVHDRSRVHVHRSRSILLQPATLERAYIMIWKSALEAVEVGRIHVACS